MTGGGTPAAVRRYVRRPLAWLPFLVCTAVAVWVADMATARAASDAFDNGFPAQAVVDSDYDGRGRVPLAYEHPIVGRTQAEAVLWTHAPPEPGDRVAIEAARVDPRDVVLAGDRYQSESLWPYAFMAAVPLVVFATRQVGTRRTATLARRAAPSFAMLAILSAGGPFRPRARLDLFPLDARADQRPLCSVPVLGTGFLPLNGPGFPVEVKGSPRPLGRVVARAGDTILWPRGRALARVHRSVLRPTVHEPPRFTERHLDAGSVAGTWAGRAGWGIGAMAAAVMLAAVVTAVTLTHRSAARALERNGVQVVARVVESDPFGYSLGVDYRLPGERTVRSGRAPVDLPEDWDVGDRYPAVVDPSEPERLRLLAEPYDATEPIVWASLPAIAAGVLLVRSRRRWRRQTALCRGPWVDVDGWVVGVDGLLPPRRVIDVALAHPSITEACCTVRLPMHHRSWWRPGERRLRLACAGTPVPGDPVVVRHGHVVVVPFGRARAPATNVHPVELVGSSGPDGSIPLRAFRIARGRPRLELAGTRLHIVLPRYFGTRPWAVPLDGTRVVDLTTHAIDAEDIGGPVTAGGTVPSFPTTNTMVEPNLMLLFRSPQRVPPCRIWAALGGWYGSVGYLRSRSRKGARVRGVLLRAVDPTDAAHRLVVAGATAGGIPIGLRDASRVRRALTRLGI